MTAIETAESLLIEAGDLQAVPADDRLLLIDAREPEAFRQGHLPGAVNLPPSSMEWSVRLADGSEVHHLLLPAERAITLLSLSGISRDSRIVIYDGGTGNRAARIFWILDYFTHPHLQILDGGLAAWESIDGPLSREDQRRQRGDFVPDPDPNKIADFRTVHSLRENDGPILLNTLPRRSFRKEAIPGSVNIPYTATCRSRNSNRLLEPEKLQQLFRRASISPARELILYCGIGYTASQLYLAARLLGYPRVRLYDGSLTDWKARGGAVEPGRAVSRVRLT